MLPLSNFLPSTPSPNLTSNRPVRLSSRKYTADVDVTAVTLTAEEKVSVASFESEAFIFTISSDVTALSNGIT